MPTRTLTVGYTATMLMMFVQSEWSARDHAAAQLLPAVSLLLKPIKPARLRALVASVRR